MPNSPIDLLSDARRALLYALKEARWSTIPELAQVLAVSTEAVRQQLGYLQREGWVKTDCDPAETDERVPGRPAAQYCLAPAADDLFPKEYAALAIGLFDELPDATGTLSALTDRRVAALRGSMREHDALRSIYRRDDPFLEVETADHGYKLIERNCPYLRFAAERPLFCSTTVSTLRRLTNAEVVREERFQDGDGRCVFHVYADAPLGKARARRRFEPEPAKEWKPRSG